MGIPRPKSGEVKVSFGKMAEMGDGLIVANGHNTSRADRSLVMGALAPLWEEMVRRGYDPKSIRFYMSK